jgi:hypothetical protein
MDPPSPGATWPDYEEIQPYYRLIANPFLLILGWLVAAGVCRLAFAWRRPAVALAGVGIFVASCVLLQFHCFDCGKTDFLHRRRGHRCEGVWARWQSGSMGRWLLPRLELQLVMWFYLIVSVAILVATVARDRR